MIPETCSACGKPLLLANVFVDDGCPCNSPRGVNFPLRTCVLCGTDDCVKPAHHIYENWGHAMRLEALPSAFPPQTLRSSSTPSETET